MGELTTIASPDLGNSRFLSLLRLELQSRDVQRLETGDQEHVVNLLSGRCKLIWGIPNNRKASDQMARPLFFDEMSAQEVPSYMAEKQALLLPLGVIEPHGDHLPVGTDTICPVGVCEVLSRELGFAIAPPLPYGILDRIVGHPGAITLSRKTYTVLLTEILEQFAKAGVRFLVICNGHGPNHGPTIEAIRDVVERYRVQFLLVEWWEVAAQHLESLFGTSDIGHGGIGEVAAILHYRPELVHFDRITSDSFGGAQEPGLLEFPLQKTANAADTECLLHPDEGKMHTLLTLVEQQVVKAVSAAYALFQQGLEADGA